MSSGNLEQNPTKPFEIVTRIAGGIESLEAAEAGRVAVIHAGNIDEHLGLISKADILLAERFTPRGVKVDENGHLSATSGDPTWLINAIEADIDPKDTRAVEEMLKKQMHYLGYDIQHCNGLTVVGLSDGEVTGVLHRLVRDPIQSSEPPAPSLEGATLSDLAYEVAEHALNQAALKRDPSLRSQPHIYASMVAAQKPGDLREPSRALKEALSQLKTMATLTIAVDPANRERFGHFGFKMIDDAIDYLKGQKDHPTYAKLCEGFGRTAEQGLYLPVDLCIKP